MLFEVAGVVEPGSGGCLDALNRWETQRARIAPTPSPPAEERLALVGFPDGLARQDRRNAAPQTPLRKV